MTPRRPPHTLATLTLLAATACAGTTERDDTVPEGSLWVPPLKQSVFLRGVFDDDPSQSIGRFLAPRTPHAAIDESNTFASRCGKAITYKVVGAGGSFDETFQSSTSVGGSIGVEKYGKLAAKYGKNGELRVKYTLKKKMVAVEDVDALSQCCDTAADQCGDGRIIREFYLGDGEVMQLLGSEKSVKAGGTYKIVDAEVDYKNGTAWKRVTKFENVYFAFKTGLVVKGRDIADDWDVKRPTSLDGQYFVGTSKPAASEQAAFQDAMLDARRQVVQYIGTVISEARVQTSKNLDDVWQDESAIQAASQGIASLVKDLRQKTRQPEGPTVRYITKVLTFVPTSKLAEMGKALAQALAANGKISAADAKKIEEASSSPTPN